MNLSAQRRFGGLQRLYGQLAAQRLFDAHVAIVGVGGVGSWAAEALARSGVCRLTLIDLDHVAESNINRQVQALHSTIGMAKVQALRERIAQIHPDCTVQCIEEFVDTSNWPHLLPAGVDAVIDACDSVAAKVLMAHTAMCATVPAATQQRMHFISVGAAGGKRKAQAVQVDDLACVTHDPLLAQVRQRLRKHHGAPRQGQPMRVSCVFSAEAVAPPDPSCALPGDGSLNCHGYGSSVSVTATFGLVAAGWVMEQIACTSSE